MPGAVSGVSFIPDNMKGIKARFIFTWSSGMSTLCTAFQRSSAREGSIANEMHYEEVNLQYHLAY